MTNQCFQQAHHLDDEEIANYQKLHETRARPIRALSNIYTPKEKPQNIEKNILDTSILTYSWKEYFEKINYKYEFVNITESMANLKEFLHLRDTRKEFEEVKSLKYVGIPAILTDENKIIVGEDVFKIK